MDLLIRLFLKGCFSRQLASWKIPFHWIKHILFTWNGWNAKSKMTPAHIGYFIAKFGVFRKMGHFVLPVFTHSSTVQFCVLRRNEITLSTQNNLLDKNWCLGGYLA